MAILFSSLRHTTSGRRKTTSTKVTKSSTKVTKSQRYVPPDIYRRETPEYNSLDTGSSVAEKKDNRELLEISSQYTVAPAYNKGAYQVISKTNIKDIGK